MSRARHLGIEAIGNAKRSRWDRSLLRVDLAVTISPLDRPPEVIIELVEAYSGLTVSRLT